ncbi:putative uncharacterized protein DDB_G0277255 [Neltuma alba]|uniref:putative uncharacterized protein DDB_G0277255 n=1 Tax=Neltuma alba TaxID=207710 RepID=UPI0010A3E139|nr:putative uncharacterized protein DDB_G0277255 [Prosopis alba]
MASSQVEFASSTSPFSCIVNTRNHHHRVTQAKNLFDHFVRDHLNSNDNGNFRSWDTNNKAKNHLGTLRFASNKKRDQDESSTLVSPNQEEPSPSSSSSSPSPSPPLRKQKPPPISVPSDFSSPCDISNLKGASSLVQIWEQRLNQSSNNTTKSSSTPKSGPSATSSSSSPQSSSSSSEEADSPQGLIHNEGDHHHQRERSVVRVADIIKRLTATSEVEIVDTNDNQIHHHLSYCVGSPEQSSENRSFVIKSPRIRGRQAFNDLLMQMECDRHGELNNLADRAAVSKFSHKGRIQALLRLRLMQRGIMAKDQRGLQSTTSQGIKKLQGSVIMRLRERFSRGMKNGSGLSSIEAEVVEEPRTPFREEEDKVSSPINNTPNPTQNPVSHIDQTKEEEEEEEEEAPPPCSNVSVCSEAQNAETSSSSMADLNAESEVSENVEGREEKHNNNVSDQTSDDEMEEEEEEEEGEGSEEEYDERMYDEIEEVGNSSEQSYGDAANFDWTSQISKPKSYWEDRRQAWYKEMLNNESQNNDICQLLQRRTVSNFLCSDFREKMDRLMESHKGTQTNLLASRDGDEANHHGKIGQLEMELIYDLRGHMKQLYHEMSELRKSIRSCIDMQMILQKSLSRENNHPGQGKKSHDRVLKKGNCCICLKMKADSLLYRYFL